MVHQLIHLLLSVQNVPEMLPTPVSWQQMQEIHIPQFVDALYLLFRVFTKLPAWSHCTCLNSKILLQHQLPGMCCCAAAIALDVFQVEMMLSRHESFVQNINAATTCTLLQVSEQCKVQQGAILQRRVMHISERIALQVTKAATHPKVTSMFGCPLTP